MKTPSGSLIGIDLGLISHHSGTYTTGLFKELLTLEVTIYLPDILNELKI